MIAKPFFLVMFACAALLPAASSADGPPSDNYACARHAQGTLTTETANTVGQGIIKPEIAVVYFIQRGQFNSNWRRDGLRGENEILFVPLKLTYGILDDWQADVVVPFMHNKTRDNFGSHEDSGLGGIKLETKVRLVCDKPGGWWPSIAGTAWIKFGNSHFTNLDPHLAIMDHYGTKNTDFAIGLNLSKRLGDFILHFNFYYDIPTSVHTDNVKIIVTDHYYYGLAAEYKLGDKSALFLEINGLTEGDYHTDTESVQRTEATNLAANLGIELDIGKGFILKAAFGMTVAGRESGFGYMPALSLSKVF